jgi:hypothetical protein
LFGQTFDFDHGVKRVVLTNCRVERTHVCFLSGFFCG